MAEVVFNNYELGNFNNDRRASPPYPQIEDLNFIFSSEPKQGEINYLCMIDNLKNNLPIGVIYNISKFI